MSKMANIFSNGGISNFVNLQHTFLKKEKGREGEQECICKSNVICKNEFSKSPDNLKKISIS